MTCPIILYFLFVRGVGAWGNRITAFSIFFRGVGAWGKHDLPPHRTVPRGIVVLTAFVVFYIHFFKVWLFCFHLQPVSVRSPVKPVGGNARKVALDEGDQRKLDLTVRCSLREVEDCAKLLESRHVAR